MAFSMGSSSGRGRRRSMSTLSEINVVPLVDVMLVLLIIFMLTAQELPVISQTAKGNLYLNDASININDIGDEVRRRFGADTKAVYIRGDKNLSWDVLSQTIAAVSEAKLQARLVTKAEDIADKRR
jgi:biopolymer transport protein TolR